jgi:nitrate/TMAO reductase-like tetraheme cytochrome c subunit
MHPGRYRLGPRVASGLLALLASPRLLAEAATPEHPLRKDYAMEWAGRLSLLGVLGAIALVAYVLLFRRRAIATAPSQWMLFIGICVMPLPVMLLGSAVGLERAKAVSFCQHCHVMRPFVADMKDAGSGTLAALHFRNRYIQRDNCYVCHTDYGVFGTMEAKLAGVLHIWRESTGSYALPVKISHPYRYLICLDCHAGSAKYERLREHEGLAAAAARGEAACSKCHGLAHLPREKRGGA